MQENEILAQVSTAMRTEAVKSLMQTHRQTSRLVAIRAALDAIISGDFGGAVVLCLLLMRDRPTRSELCQAEHLLRERSVAELKPVEDLRVAYTRGILANLRLTEQEQLRQIREVWFK